MTGFRENSEKPPFSPFFGTFFKFFGKPDFFSKIRLSRFTRNTKLQLHAKNQKKLMNGSPDMKTDGRTDGHTHGRTDGLRTQAVTQPVVENCNVLPD